MALLLENLTFLQEYFHSTIRTLPSKTENPLKVGVLSTATINSASVIRPVETHPDVVLYAIGSRDLKQAKEYAAKYGFKVPYGSYEEVIRDPEVDFVYISLPNQLHFEWSFKALQHGKHVLCEKPITDTPYEAERLTDTAKRNNKILMEAFHWKFHPAAHVFREILDSREYGRILKTDAIMTATPAIPAKDIRWQYDLGGGSLMDMTYALSFTRYAIHAGTPDTVLHAKARPASGDERIDAAMQAHLRFTDRSGKDVYSSIYTDMARSWWCGVVPRFWELPSIHVELEHAEVTFYNAMMPHLYHYIEIKDKRSGEVLRKQAYKGGPLWGERGEAWWSTYRYQLEAFVDKLRGREPVCWQTSKDSINQMKTIDEVYCKSTLPSRPSFLDK
ncbi:putative NAD binding Rossmann fold oxidoreductase [Macrolepiota fuliginosa MF-IS2]|uniref:D-xylose 1-dehydrogenase (NADP(+), D-xylono-1,5-lactone-forming) n=1 Tax=Macrolepiota fuliginosa MF-IS2 TaxID=1400762 RepID=A0A9P5XMI3_9AGAR|nr:putative NAD binding Rossmann fold oxidoreductase [Macrolepiota fuliginosa MF-IS2]